MENLFLEYGGEQYVVLLNDGSLKKECLRIDEYVLYIGEELSNYQGGIVIAKDVINAFDFNDKYPCYCYQIVLELIMSEGKVITTINHSRAMHRIRMNIEKGLRSLDNEMDLACINKFLRATFVKKYAGRNFFFNRWWLFRRNRNK
ncbi:MAG: hypothetical protein ACERKN_15785 [Velocimicrobium sp.]